MTKDRRRGPSWEPLPPPGNLMQSDARYLLHQPQPQSVIAAMMLLAVSVGRMCYDDLLRR